VTVLPIKISMDQVESISQNWKIREVAILGSVFRKDVDSKTSDVYRIEKVAIKKSRSRIRKNKILNSYEVLYERAA
jgi:hypothetical protein